MQTIRINKGTILNSPAPSNFSSDAVPESSQSVRKIEPQSQFYFGSDFDDLRPELHVREGQQVLPGQLLFVDKKNAAVRIFADVAGTVSAIRFGKRKVLDHIEIHTDFNSREKVEIDVSDGSNDLADSLSPTTTSPKPTLGNKWKADNTPREVLNNLRSSHRAEIKTGLIEAGLFPIFRTRPFNRIPVADSTPDHVFVNAIDTNPFAPDPRTILYDSLNEFHSGLQVLTKLTDGNVFVCQSPGSPLSDDRVPGIVDIAFKGPHPAGNTGTHINQVYQLNRSRVVWAVDYREVAALGHLLETGRIQTERVVSIYDPREQRVWLVNAPIGSDVASLLTTADTKPSTVTAALPDRTRTHWCGNLFTGKNSTHLHRFDRQLIISEVQAQENVATPSAYTHPREAQASPANQPQSLLAEPWLEDISPLTRSLTLLLRSLLCGDYETAEACGSLRFAAEDIELASRLLGDRYDFARILNMCNEQIRADLISTPGQLDATNQTISA